MIQPLNPFSPNQIVFGYNSVLKDEYRQNPEMREHVKKGLYGGNLSLKDLTLEHVQPHVYGGRDSLSNFALATAKNNQARGQAPLANFLTKDMFEKYAKEFEGWEAELFDNKSYIDNLAISVQRQGVDLGLEGVPIGDLIKNGAKRVKEISEKQAKKLAKKARKEARRLARQQALEANAKELPEVNLKEVGNNLDLKEVATEVMEVVQEVGKHIDFKA